MDDKMQAFIELWKKFKEGTVWLNRRICESKLTKNEARLYNPKLEQDMKEFEMKVIKPMDEAWCELEKKDRENFLKTFDDRFCAR